MKIVGNRTTTTDTSTNDAVTLIVVTFPILFFFVYVSLKWRKFGLIFFRLDICLDFCAKQFSPGNDLWKIYGVDLCTCIYFNVWILYSSSFIIFVAALLVAYTICICVFQGLTAVYLVTYFSDYRLWKCLLPVVHVSSGRIFEIIMHGKSQPSYCVLDK